MPQMLAVRPGSPADVLRSRTLAGATRLTQKERRSQAEARISASEELAGCERAAVCIQCCFRHKVARRTMELLRLAREEDAIELAERVELEQLAGLTMRQLEEIGNERAERHQHLQRRGKSVARFTVPGIEEDLHLASTVFREEEPIFSSPPLKQRTSAAWALCEVLVENNKNNIRTQRAGRDLAEPSTHESREFSVVTCRYCGHAVCALRPPYMPFKTPFPRPAAAAHTPHPIPRLSSRRTLHGSSPTSRRRRWRAARRTTSPSSWPPTRRCPRS